MLVCDSCAMFWTSRREARAFLGVGGQVLRQETDDDQPPHGGVNGLEGLAGDPRAEPLHDAVLSEHRRFALAGQEVVGLVGGQQTRG